MHEQLELLNGACYVVVGALIIGEHAVPTFVEKQRARLELWLRGLGSALGTTYVGIGGLKLMALLGFG